MNIKPTLIHELSRLQFKTEKTNKRYPETTYCLLKNIKLVWN